MKECDYCYLKYEGKECDSVTCVRHREYMKARVKWERVEKRPHVVLSDCESHPVITCLFHIGFIGIEETEEMLELLRKKDDSEKKKDGPSYSRIGESNHWLSPINRTAAAVAQWVSLLRLPKV